ncbi:MAG: hypothetical protein U0637_11180 [Phycisphaerales bacterium]
MGSLVNHLPMSALYTLCLTWYILIAGSHAYPAYAKRSGATVLVAVPALLYPPRLAVSAASSAM